LGNAYKLALAPTQLSGALSQCIYYAPNLAAGSNTVTVKFTSAAVYPDVRVMEYSGLNTFVSGAGASGTGTTASSGTFTTNIGPAVIIGASTVSASTIQPAAGYTMRLITNADADGGEDMLANSADSYSRGSRLPMENGSPAGEFRWVSSAERRPFAPEPRAACTT
jgi:hypothetical protein